MRRSNSHKNFLLQHRAVCMLLATICTLAVFAQQSGIDNAAWADRKEHTNVLSIRYGAKYTMDEYFSPLLYTGHELAIRNWTEQELATNWIHIGEVSLRGAKVTQSQKKNLIYELGLQAGWGAMWDWRYAYLGRKHIRRTELLENGSEWRILVGPYLQGDLEIRQISGNVNKPFSFDAALDLMAAGKVAYRIRKHRLTFGVEYGVRTNLLGGQWLPEYGTSYYEVTEGQVGRNIGFSWLGNRHLVQQEVVLEFAFRRSTWRVGMEHEYLSYGSAIQRYKRQYLGIVIGAKWKYKVK